MHSNAFLFCLTQINKYIYFYVLHSSSADGQKWQDRVDIVMGMCAYKKETEEPVFL